MALESTDIVDRHGAGLYFLHDGTLTQSRRVGKIAQELQAKIPHVQVVQLSVRDRDGERIRDFYDVQHAQLPVAMIIRDNDELAGLYISSDLPSGDQLAHIIKSVG